MKLSQSFVVLILSVLIASCGSSKTVKQEAGPSLDTYEIEEKEAINRLSQGIRHKTVSLEDTTEINYEYYEGFIDFLEQNYPYLHQSTEHRRIGEYSLLYKWEGTQADLKPALLMGHYDVVPSKADTDSLWQYKPFGGQIAEGYVWGRGALDDKSGIMSVLEATEYLLENDFQPDRTIYIALHHDEEVGGIRGARRVADYLENQEIELAFVVDEGLPIAEEIIEGIEIPLAMIGVAEKGSVNIELVYNQDGGHSSMPPRTSVIGTLSKAVNRIEQRPMDAHYKGLIVETFEPLIPYMTYKQQLAFNNTWLFRGLIKRKLSRNPATNAALRTTAAKTIFEAGFKENVLPVSGRVIINFRVHPNNTIEDVERYVRKRIRNSDIHVRVMDRARNPSPVSDTNTQPYGMLNRTIQSSFDPVLVSPSLFIAASDSRHFHNLSSNIYRFRPIRAKHEDRSRVHGVDERISVENYLEMIQFQIKLLKNGSSEL
jgi:carboxypeptidase PM20D1